MDYLVCSDCFKDEGLRLDAFRLGIESHFECKNCGSVSGKVLNDQQLSELTYRFFVWGSFLKTDYGGTPLIQFNEYQETSVEFTENLKNDANLIGVKLGVGFFHYGPRMWFLGEIEPLKKLIKKSTQKSIVNKILKKYPRRIIETNKKLYRIRKFPGKPDLHCEYDSPPSQFLGCGRFDSKELPILYTSEDLQVCLHECRVTAEDELYIATLSPTRPLNVLDLSVVLEEPDHVTEFESLDIAMHMLFMAAKHSYEITRVIALAAQEAKFDGIIYPSFFSLLRLGVMPLRNIRGISHRKIPEMHDQENSFTTPNLAIFGRPIQSGLIKVDCLNKICLTRVEYSYIFGPAAF